MTATGPGVRGGGGVSLTVVDSRPERQRRQEAPCTASLEAPTCDDLYKKARQLVNQRRRSERRAAESRLSPAGRLALLRRQRQRLENLQRGLARSGRQNAADAMAASLAERDAEIEALERTYPELVTIAPPPPQARLLETASEADTLRAQVDAATAQNDQLRAAAQQVSDENVALREALDEANAQSDDLRAALDNASSQIHDLNAALGSQTTSAEAEDLRAALNAAQAEADDLRAALDRAASQVDALMDALRIEQQRTTQQSEAARERIDALETEVSERDDRLAQLDAYVDQLQEGLEQARDLVDANAALTEDRDTLAAINGRVTAERDDLRARLAAQTQTVRSLAEALEAAERLDAAQQEERTAVRETLDTVAGNRAFDLASLTNAVQRAPESVNTTAIRQLRDYVRLVPVVEGLQAANRALRRQVNAASQQRANEANAARIVTALTGRAVAPVPLYATPRITGLGQQQGEGEEEEENVPGETA